jgi:hypothetical protein
VTEKIHGTSARIGHVLIDRKLGWLEKILAKLGVRIELQEWAYLNGSRRVVLEESKGGAAFHDPTIRDKAFALFDGKLRKGETVYCEIFGFEPGGKPIMEGVEIKKKEGVAVQGDHIVVSAGVPFRVAGSTNMLMVLTVE